jgi:hypothetical protein
MAVGDVVSAISSIPSGSYLDILPGAGAEWVIHNIYHASDIELHYFDGSNDITFDTETGTGVYAKYAFHCNNSVRVRVKNTTGGAALIGYDGAVTK